MKGGVVTLGETMGLFTATEGGSLAQATGFRLSIGGAESNVAIGLARLGTPVTWIGRVGHDELGDRIRRELRAEGVTTSPVIDSAARTGLMLKSHPTPDRTRVAFYRAGSAGSRLSPEDVDARVIESADLLHVTGIAPALSASAASAVERAIELAVDAGVPVSFDVNHRSSLWSAADAAPVYRRIAARASIVFAGVEEARMLVGGEDPMDLAKELALLGPTQAIVKLGSDGCVASIGGTVHRADAIPVNAVDTIGAGDAFVAGYLSGLLIGSGPATRLATAVRCGAFACLGPGDWESFPTRDDLELLSHDADPVSR
jgi:2-dehydro-3-deoxygluconokinase